MDSDKSNELINNSNSNSEASSNLLENSNTHHKDKKECEMVENDSKEYELINNDDDINYDELTIEGDTKNNDELTIEMSNKNSVIFSESTVQSIYDKQFFNSFEGTETKLNSETTDLVEDLKPTCNQEEYSIIEENKESCFYSDQNRDSLNDQNRNPVDLCDSREKSMLFNNEVEISRSNTTECNNEFIEENKETLFDGDREIYSNDRIVQSTTTEINSNNQNSRLLEETIIDSKNNLMQADYSFKNEQSMENTADSDNLNNLNVFNNRDELINMTLAFLNQEQTTSGDDENNKSNRTSVNLLNLDTNIDESTNQENIDIKLAAEQTLSLDDNINNNNVDKELENFHSFKRIIFSKSTIKKIIKKTNSGNISSNCLFLLGGILKIHIAEIVQKAISIKNNVYKEIVGPLKPYHIRSAAYQLLADNKVNVLSNRPTKRRCI